MTNAYTQCNITREEIIEAISDDKMMPFIQTDQLANIVDFVINNYKPSLPSNLDEAADTYSENIISNGEDMFDAIADGFRAGAELVMTRIKWKKPQDCHLKNFTEVVVLTKDGSVYFNAQFVDGDFRIWGDEWWEKIDEEIAGWILQEDVESLLRWNSCL